MGTDENNTAAPPPHDGERGESEVEDDASKDDRPPREVGGRAGPDPTRYGDWEKNGRCIDF